MPNQIPMENELELEKEALAKIDPEQIKADLIIELGLDETEDAEKLEKIVAREVKTRTMAAKAIGSKIKTREELEDLKKAPPKKVDDDDLDKKLEEKLEKRDLESLDLPDELKAEIKKVASTQGISVKAALTDPYIKFKLDAHEKEKKADDASISRTNRSGASTKFDFSNPPDVDMNTKEGREEWEKWKQVAKKAGH